jgi:nucleoside-diphosphate-sugar epimerase
MNNLPRLIVTGASGIVGSSFLDAAKENFRIYAIARRSQNEAGISPHPNIIWIQVDIGDWLGLRWVMHNIKREGGADFILHLAGYYDFEYTPNEEYERSNIKGTQYVLEQAKILRVKRFIFASSSAASEFPKKGEALTEKSTLNALYDYARSKKAGEEMVGEFSRFFPCSFHMAREEMEFKDPGRKGGIGHTVYPCK